MKEFIAHLKEEHEKWYIHSLSDHLFGVAELAKCFGNTFNNGDWAEKAALLHDLGKSSSDFQKYISHNSGYIQEADQAPGRVNHSSHGAVFTNENWPQIGKIFAYLIAGHHGGLPDWNHEIGIGGNLSYRLKKSEQEKLPVLNESTVKEWTDKVLPPSSSPCIGTDQGNQIHLWIRMLFSCLVDADFLDTEAFMNPDNSSMRSSYRSLPKLRELFDKHMNKIKLESRQSNVNQLREQILNQCIKAAELAPGLFSLSVPTGGGKTLSSMAFALKHASIHRKDRIIVVIPYTSIIEQTARVYKNIFGNENVIEHHSSLDPEHETVQSRLASENWDAPIIVTTNVQFFESLFSSKPSSCRKLHNIANSVVILDEVQMLPTDYLEPILHIINGLTSHFNVSMVLSSATQPAIDGKIFQKPNGEKYSILNSETCREIMRYPSPEQLNKSLQRVEIIQWDAPVDNWCNLAKELTQYGKVLCVVNTRKDCRDLFEHMPEGSIHLSANMCGEHRSSVIEDIKKKLKGNTPVRVISTQLVEAGVDFDFPVVFRAMAGFDSIAQAAGRCNREGEMAENGKVVVFTPPEQAPAGILRKGAQVGKTILDLEPEGCRRLKPETIRRYFELYFSSLNSFDKKEIMDLLTKDIQQLNIQFRTASQKFRMIDNASQISVVVWFEGDKTDSRELIEILRRKGPNKRLMRKLQRFTVTIPESRFIELKGAFEEIHGVWCQDVDSIYHGIYGFTSAEKFGLMMC